MTERFLDRLQFYRQFRTRFETTGAITPSSRFLAKACTGPLKRRSGPARVLEVGPGTGVVTREIVQDLRLEDSLDLVELNEDFAAILTRRFEEEAEFQRVADRCRLHVCAMQQFPADGCYDYIISGLPLNNFSAELVSEIFEIFFRLLVPGGVLSYFEYMGVRSMRKLVAKGPEKVRLQALDQVAGTYLSQHRIRRDWIFPNVPPAWVQHLRRPEAQAAADSKAELEIVTP